MELKNRRTIRVKDSLWNRLSVQAEIEELKISAIIRKAAYEYLDRKANEYLDRQAAKK